MIYRERLESTTSKLGLKQTDPNGRTPPLRKPPNTEKKKTHILVSRRIPYEILYNMLRSTRTHSPTSPRPTHRRVRFLRLPLIHPLPLPLPLAPRAPSALCSRSCQRVVLPEHRQGMRGDDGCGEIGPRRLFDRHFPRCLREQELGAVEGG